jgi:hypothetical protein
MRNSNGADAFFIVLHSPHIKWDIRLTPSQQLRDAPYISR